MEILDKYFELQNEIYQYFGYQEDWKVIPLEDNREMFWLFDGSKVYYANDTEDFGTGQYFEGVLYAQRFLSKWVYEGQDYTMIYVDTRCDGNKFLMIFSNDRKIPDDKVDEVCAAMENWQ